MFCGNGEESYSDAVRGHTFRCPSSRPFPSALHASIMQWHRQAGRQVPQGSHAWIVLLGEPLDLRLNVSVRSDGEDKSERWRGSWSDLLTEDTGFMCVEEQFGGRPQPLALKPSEGSPSLWSATTAGGLYCSPRPDLLPSLMIEYCLVPMCEGAVQQVSVTVRVWYLCSHRRPSTQSAYLGSMRLRSCVAFRRQR